ncbi:hypothetical protein AMATHDRAFT_70266 [Amanita thiersii Skay4041]|uniref:Uncharacterized protein n=1 Tax=Amanita thiersii Skay4041 TaxID=703135 RepID=A0A2A9N8R7_9AGAR|nr:hypothetical protein AMATHDRAFT_70266 [Amanita thiersii Skay4041]
MTQVRIWVTRDRILPPGSPFLRAEMTQPAAKSSILHNRPATPALITHLTRE